MGIFTCTINNENNTNEKENNNKSSKILNPKIENKIKPSPELNKNIPKIEENENKFEFMEGDIQLILFNEAKKSLCKIIISEKIGTGFFLNIDNSKKYLVTAYHIISENDINKDIKLEIYNKSSMKLKPENRDIKYFKEKDITIIEIKEIDEILKVYYVFYKH